MCIIKIEEMESNHFKKDPFQELRKAIQYEKDELRRQVNRSWAVLLVMLLLALITVIPAAYNILTSLPQASSFHATHFERAVLADYNGKKTVYLINGNDTTRMEVK